MCLNTAAALVFESCPARSDEYVIRNLMDELNLLMNQATALMCSSFTYRRPGNPSPDKSELTTERLVHLSTEGENGQGEKIKKIISYPFAYRLQSLMGKSHTKEAHLR